MLIFAGEICAAVEKESLLLADKQDRSMFPLVLLTETYQ